MTPKEMKEIIDKYIATLSKEDMATYVGPEQGFHSYALDHFNKWYEVNAIQ